jgi:hypothetical protein
MIFVTYLGIHGVKFAYYKLEAINGHCPHVFPSEMHPLFSLTFDVPQRIVSDQPPWGLDQCAFSTPFLYGVNCIGRHM